MLTHLLDLMTLEGKHFSLEDLTNCVTNQVEQIEPFQPRRPLLATDMDAEADEVVGSEVGVVTHDGLDRVDDAFGHVRDLVSTIPQDLEIDPDATTGVP
ncbi:hypothetical protein COV05_01495 [Candidatus Uhrbacteria bacterium CG10_big_fil_rev_8_21_14_0_10_48_16]|uniref:Uncharacterized protein n=1 Tax=Candidatus Uhrbacteria bacterium CG10_big_fil_rev_8_21_14_0_10_48_16 TaxID=1975038 RepID=A0A2M8LI05_9BACT|nr:MAG: hypothetical protein COV05_01495 [Candidatus Uhrbacteria bacterium CG10_big_fil_rev_8_21_14_0_10_48_16]